MAIFKVDLGVLTQRGLPTILQPHGLTPLEFRACVYIEQIKKPFCTFYRRIMNN